MRVFITGASGYLAWELVRQFHQVEKYDIVCASSAPEKLRNDAHYGGTTVIGNDDIGMALSPGDVVIHTAFCRESKGDRLMESLSFSKALFQRAAESSVKSIINISSQSVYGSGEGVLPDEQGRYSPEYLYALAKSSSELLLDSIAAGRIGYTSVRLASLVGPSKNVPVNVLYRFVQNALEGKDIVIRGGHQRFSFIDVRDAAEAIIGLLQLDNLEVFYNLGPETQTNIQDLAREAVDYAISRGRPGVEISLIEEDIPLNAGMNSQRLYNALHWRPRYTISDTLRDTAPYLSAL